MDEEIEIPKTFTVTVDDIYTMETIRVCAEYRNISYEEAIVFLLSEI